MTARSRRRLLKVLGVALPATWIRPVVESIVLPVHARTTAVPDVATVQQASIQGVELEGEELNIGNLPVNYSIEIANPNDVTLSVISVQAWIVQGAAERAATGYQVNGCGASLGDLDPGTCNVGLSFAASNTSSGTGTLVPGTAMARFDLRDDGVVIDQIFVEITLI